MAGLNQIIMKTCFHAKTMKISTDFGHFKNMLSAVRSSEADLGQRNSHMEKCSGDFFGLNDM